MLYYLYRSMYLWYEKSWRIRTRGNKQPRGTSTSNKQQNDSFVWPAKCSSGRGWGARYGTYMQDTGVLLEPRLSLLAVLMPIAKIVFVKAPHTCTTKPINLMNLSCTRISTRFEIHDKPATWVSLTLYSVVGCLQWFICRSIRGTHKLHPKVLTM
jgi:hypothetical protein